ncbi:3'-5' exonuclease [Xanthovirga aplysinae]|uniref:3'-5' exonuclease n=1 Tax=Xanthovirga aplysinae TaxID=2529853 RepID=UPI0012BD08C7|nr:3'-5' exonuclease [Xanthovirga aplysinae]MTI32886.1 DNA polymerase III subunit epsilon [Xanthovirga aplysinae]
MNFTAIDFETATGARNSACAVGIVTVENSQITDKYYTLIQPPENAYFWRNINVHGITPKETEDAPIFPDIYFEIKKRLEGRIIVAHNEAFDRGVLSHTMSYYSLDYDELLLSPRWECTLKIYRQKGYKPANLATCCQRNNIALNHHEALSDAEACAKLYLLK